MTDVYRECAGDTHWCVGTRSFAEPTVAPASTPRSPRRHRARTTYTKFEFVNSRLYEGIRRDIQRGAGGSRLREWMPDWNAAANLVNSGYDYLNELISGVLQLEEPSTEVVQLKREMVPYQPTPARHISDFIGRAALTERDLLIDLGSGLGHA